MNLFGLTPPNDKGETIEVHLDIQNDSPSFMKVMEEYGFEDDPFEIFFPAGYQRHMTGRICVPKKKLAVIVPKVKDLVEHVITEAKNHDLDLYAEIEILRARYPFVMNDALVEDGVLDCIELLPTDQFGAADADIHLEFLAGAVSSQTRSYLESKGFYWVKTPATKLFPSEEIATLQTDTLGGAKQIFQILIERPLAKATCIHLEQKLAMLSTRKGLAMPQVIRVVRS
jgi:hypothetical protein